MWTRSKLGEITKVLNWGVIFGDNFGYDINQNDPKTKIIGEYELYEKNEHHHILIYNKLGLYAQEENELLKKMIRKKKGISIMKPIALVLIVLSYIWLSSACEDKQRRKESTVINSICVNKFTVIIVISLAAVLLFIADSFIGNIGVIKRRSQYYKKMN